MCNSYFYSLVPISPHPVYILGHTWHFHIDLEVNLLPTPARSSLSPVGRMTVQLASTSTVSPVGAGMAQRHAISSCAFVRHIKAPKSMKRRSGPSRRLGDGQLAATGPTRGISDITVVESLYKNTLLNTLIHKIHTESPNTSYKFPNFKYFLHITNISYKFQKFPINFHKLHMQLT